MAADEIAKLKKAIKDFEAVMDRKSPQDIKELRELKRDLADRTVETKDMPEKKKAKTKEEPKEKPKAKKPAKPKAKTESKPKAKAKPKAKESAKQVAKTETNKLPAKTESKSKALAESKPKEGEYIKRKRPPAQSTRRSGLTIEGKKVESKPKALPSKPKEVAKGKSTGGRSGAAARKKAFGAGSTAAERNRSRLAVKSKTDGVKVSKVAKKASSQTLKRLGGIARVAGGPLVSALAIGIPAAIETSKENKATAERHNKLRSEAKARKDKSLDTVKSSTGNKSGARKLYEERLAKRRKKPDPKKALTSPPKKAEAKTKSTPKVNTKPSTSKPTQPAKKPQDKKTTNAPQVKSKVDKKKTLQKESPAAANLRKKFNELNAYKGTFADYKREHLAKKAKRKSS